MTAETTRRLVLAGAAAAVPTLSLPTFADPAPDPLFAAIEKNRQAYIARMRACRIAAKAVPNEPHGMRSEQPRRKLTLQATRRLLH
jgi:hypothetical protein